MIEFLLTQKCTVHLFLLNMYILIFGNTVNALITCYTDISQMWTNYTAFRKFNSKSQLSQSPPKTFTHV